MATITIDNWAASLVLSTAPRSGAPDGNVYFNTAVSPPRVELITVEDLATVDLGAGLVANPLSDNDGITAQAIYAFMLRERRLNEDLRHFLQPSEGVFKLAGAFALVNGWLLGEDGTLSDWAKIRGSGLVVRGEGATLGAQGPINRIYFGARSLNFIDPASQPYYQLVPSTSDADLQSVAPVDFSRPGPVDEMVQVFGTTANGDAGAGDFDATAQVLVLTVRTFGNLYGRTDSVLTGITELGGFAAGFGVGEADNTANTFALADVLTAPVAPFDGLSLESFVAGQSRAGFSTGAHDYSIIINNSGGATLNEVRAWLDAISQSDTDSDGGAGSLLGARANELYTIDGQGKLVTGPGIHIDGLGAADQQSVIQTDDTGTGRTYPFNSGLSIEVGAAAVADVLCWYEVFYADGAAAEDFNAAGAVTVNDAAGSPMVGFCSPDAAGTKVVKDYDYDGNTQAGLPAGVDKEMIVLVEGDGGVKQARAVFTMTRSSTISVTAVPPVEDNL